MRERDIDQEWRLMVEAQIYALRGQLDAEPRNESAIHVAVEALEQTGVAAAANAWGIALLELVRDQHLSMDQRRKMRVTSDRQPRTQYDGVFSPGTMLLTILVAIVAILGLTWRLWWRRSHAAL